jgi:hypothetical protein
VPYPVSTRQRTTPAKPAARKALATADRRSFAAATEAFLAQHLGGLRQPIGDDFDGSTITFKAGLDLIS